MLTPAVSLRPEFANGPSRLLLASTLPAGIPNSFSPPALRPAFQGRRGSVRQKFFRVFVSCYEELYSYLPKKQCHTERRPTEQREEAAVERISRQQARVGSEGVSRNHVRAISGRSFGSTSFRSRGQYQGRCSDIPLRPLQWGTLRIHFENGSGVALYRIKNDD
ncbi:MAG: hypothetical protein U5K69_22290 [Balneolaceae bacterium]|nr:hypothetical protein [Balneolaceae bacterium]